MQIHIIIKHFHYDIQQVNIENYEIRNMILIFYLKYLYRFYDGLYFPHIVRKQLNFRMNECKYVLKAQ